MRLGEADFFFSNTLHILIPPSGPHALTFALLLHVLFSYYLLSSINYFWVSLFSYPFFPTSLSALWRHRLCPAPFRNFCSICKIKVSGSHLCPCLLSHRDRQKKERLALVWFPTNGGRYAHSWNPGHETDRNSRIWAEFCRLNVAHAMAPTISLKGYWFFYS